MKKFHLVILLSIYISSAHAQTISVAEKYAETITKEDLNDHLSILASDALEGRETGKRGLKMAAALISSHFESLGLEPPVNIGETKSYYQPVPLYSIALQEAYVKTKGEKYTNLGKVNYYGSASTDKEMSSSVIFLGKGTEADIENIDLKGKAVLLISLSRGAWRAPLRRARDSGASLILISSSATEEQYEANALRFRSFFSTDKVSLNKPENESEYKGVFFIAPSVASKIFSKSYEELNEAIAANDTKAISKIKPGKVTFTIDQKVKPFSSSNVLGLLEGNDLKDEVVIISGHYDHIGKSDGLINNGANDNGSGTSAILELAQAFSIAKSDGNGPRRSILFIAFTGEEKGLLGSEYYTDFPTIPLEKTIVDLNIDMIGRIDPKYKDNEDNVFLVGSDRLSTELHEISENINKNYTKLTLDYTYNDVNHPEQIYFRSDHWNFAKNNVPVIFYSDGDTEDYHKPTDTTEKINFDILKKRTELIFYTAWELANRDKKPVVDKGQN